MDIGYLRKANALFSKMETEDDLILALASLLSPFSKKFGFLTLKDNTIANHSWHATVPKEDLSALCEIFTKLLEKDHLLYSVITTLGVKGHYQYFASATNPSLILVFEPLDYKEYMSFFLELFEASLFSVHKITQTQELLYKDALTDLYNYRFLRIALEREISRAKRFKETFSLIFIDVDNLKAVNDEHGHLFGSQVLKDVAKLLKAHLREIDTIIRYGGDEYIVLLLGAKIEQATMVAERIRHAVNEHSFQDGEQQTRLTVSMGIACYPEHAHNAQELISQADKAMYDGKKCGKNQVRSAWKNLSREMHAF